MEIKMENKHIICNSCKSTLSKESGKEWQYCPKCGFKFNQDINFTQSTNNQPTLTMNYSIELNDFFGFPEICSSCGAKATDSIKIYHYKEHVGRNIAGVAVAAIFGGGYVATYHDKYSINFPVCSNCKELNPYNQDSYLLKGYKKFEKSIKKNLLLITTILYVPLSIGIFLLLHRSVNMFALSLLIALLIIMVGLFFTVKSKLLKTNLIKYLQDEKNIGLPSFEIKDDKLIMTIYSYEFGLAIIKINSQAKMNPGKSLVDETNEYYRLTKWLPTRIAVIYSFFAGIFSIIFWSTMINLLKINVNSYFN
jgi:hypothetical protein